MSISLIGSLFRRPASIGGLHGLNFLKNVSPALTCTVQHTSRFYSTESIETSDELLWRPKKRISRETMEKIRSLASSNPGQYTTMSISTEFKISPEAVKRILKSRFTPSDEEAKRQENNRYKAMGERRKQLKDIYGEPDPRERQERIAKSRQTQENETFGGYDINGRPVQAKRFTNSNYSRESSLGQLKKTDWSRDRLPRQDNEDRGGRGGGERYGQMSRERSGSAFEGRRDFGDRKPARGGSYENSSRSAMNWKNEKFGQTNNDREGRSREGYNTRPSSFGDRSGKTSWGNDRFGQRSEEGNGQFSAKPRFDKDRPRYESKPRFEDKPGYEDKPRFEGKSRFNEDRPRYEDKPRFEDV
ncbi:hypothetical protein J3Q64DRAFT_1409891 [Phycomyces blakesleeanus]|uniref:Required for respiratory growth protein 9, mitochondrial n=1 Tax=Phycomyces blakesleeanus TaxID=4837 RepID=A0ABR3B7F7_PHYBL